MPTGSDEKARTSARCLVACVALIVACATSACGSNREGGTSTSTGGSSGSGGGGSAGVGGASGSGGTGASSGDGSTDGFSTDIRVDDSTADGLLPPNRDASDNPNCRLPATPPATCFVADPPPPPSPRVQCLRWPREFADPMGYIRAIRMRADTLYWTTEANVGLWQKKGPANPEMLLPMPNIAQFEVDDVALYFSATGDAGQTSLLRMNLDKTGLTTLIPAFQPGRFAIDEDRIYFDTSDGMLVAASKSNGGIIEVVAGPVSVNQMVGTDATHIYWNEGEAPDVTLKRVLKSSNNIETLATQLPAPAQRLQGDGVLVVVESRYILEVPKVGGCPLLLVSTAGFSYMTADDGAIYWRSNFGSDLNYVLLYRAPRSGGVVVDLFGGSAGIRGNGPIFLTPTQVVFTGEGAFGGRSSIQVTDRF